MNDPIINNCYSPPPVYPASAHIYPVSPVTTYAKNTRGFDWVAFAIGLLVGVIIIILLTWLAYSQRWLWFANCG